MLEYSVTLPNGPVTIEAANFDDLRHKVFLHGARSGEVLRVALNGEDLGYRAMCSVNHYLFEDCGV